MGVFTDGRFAWQGESRAFWRGDVQGGGAVGYGQFEAGRTVCEFLGCGSAGA